MKIQIIKAIFHESELLTPSTVIEVKDRIGKNLIATGAGIEYEEPFIDEEDLNYEAD